jgi:hypothetical protein
MTGEKSLTRFGIARLDMQPPNVDEATIIANTRIDI